MQVWTMEVIREGDEYPLQLLVADVPPRMSLKEAGEDLYRDHATQLTSIDALLIRRRDWNSISFEDAKPLRQRANRVPLHSLYGERFEHRLSPNLNPQMHSPITQQVSAGQILHSIREAELRRLLHVSGALFRPQGGYIYRVPSGKYTLSLIHI